MNQPNPGNPVRVRIFVDCGYVGADYETEEEIPRDEWDALTPAERVALLDEFAVEIRNERIDYGWRLDDDTDRAATEGGQR